LRGRAHGVEPEDRARRHDDPGAGPARGLDQIQALEQRAGAQCYQGAARLDGGHRHRVEGGRRHALDHDLRPLGEHVRGHHRYRDPECCEALAGAFTISCGDRGEPVGPVASQRATGSPIVPNPPIPTPRVFLSVVLTGALPALVDAPSIAAEKRICQDRRFRYL
jgi:hypothetical protein